MLSKPGQNETALDLFALLKATNHGCAQDFLWVYLSRESRKSVKHPLAWQALNDPHSFSSVPLIGCRQIQNLWVLSTFNMSWLCSSTVNQNHGKQSCRSNMVLKSPPQSLLHLTQNLPTKSNPNSSIHLHDVGPFSHAAHTHVTWDKKKKKKERNAHLTDIIISRKKDYLMWWGQFCMLQKRRKSLSLSEIGTNQRQVSKSQTRCLVEPTRRKDLDTSKAYILRMETGWVITNKINTNKKLMDVRRKGQRKWY